MRLRRNKNAHSIIESHRDIVLPLDTKLDFLNIFGNCNPVHVEIGMGKGDFIIQNAICHPQINYIGIEKYDSVLVAALKKLEMHDKIPNLRLLCLDASLLLDYFDINCVDCIYLNFSDPWPKSRHYKRRLTYSSYLTIYEKLLKEDGHIEFKTDNRSLFEYSLISMNHYGMTFEDICLDLHHSDGYEENIMTEYERKFSPYGPIYRIVTQFKKGE